MKTRILLLLLFIILFLGGCLLIYWNIQPQPAKYKEDVLAYLDERGAVAEDAGMPCNTVDEEGRIISVDLEDWKVYRIVPFLENAQIQRVKKIPELDYPMVNIGDRMRGNNEKLYYTYSNSRTIVEFTLNDTDSLAFLLFLTDAGTPYQEVREFYAPRHLPVKIGGTGYGDFNMFSFRIPEMNQCIEFWFREEDSEEFYQYVKGLQ